MFVRVLSLFVSLLFCFQTAHAEMKTATGGEAFEIFTRYFGYVIRPGIYAGTAGQTGDRFYDGTTCAMGFGKKSDHWYVWVHNPLIRSETVRFVHSEIYEVRHKFVVPKMQDKVVQFGIGDDLWVWAHIEKGKLKILFTIYGRQPRLNCRVEFTLGDVQQPLGFGRRLFRFNQ